jgi:hypothetical protein
MNEIAVLLLITGPIIAGGLLGILLTWPLLRR